MWHSPKFICIAPRGQKGVFTMTNNTNTTNAAANNAVKEANTMSNNTTTNNTAGFFSTNNARVAGATPFTLLGAGLAAGAEVCRKAAEFIGGDQVSRAPGYGYLAAHTTGKLSSKRMAAMAEALKAQAAMKEEKAEKIDHSDMVEWKRGRWIPSEKATAQAKKNGHDQAFLPQMYKAANWIIRVVKEGGDKVYSAANGETHTYLGWVYKNVFGHASFMEGKGVKNAKAAEKLKEYFEQACKHSRVSADKLPTWEQVCAAVQAEQKLAKEEAAEEKAEAPRITVEEDREILSEEMAEEIAMLKELPDQEARDGRAPKTAPATNVNVKGIVRALGIVRLKEDNAWEVAEKAKAAFEAATLTEEEFYAVVDACQAKDADADPEEYMALLGEN